MHHFHDRMHRFAERFDEAWTMGRHGHRHGFGPFAHGFMGGPGMGGQGMRFGRKLASGDLQVVLLALLAEQPSHGYELIKALEERSGGFYSPSPGMVYPALTWLEEVGYASVTQDGAKKLYTITDSGREFLEKNRESADAILRGFEQIGRRMGRVREAFAGDDDEGDEQRGGTWRELWVARRELKQALRERRHVLSAKEAKRIAQILKDAAAQIRGEE